jgi:Calcineurin-like phosphoesterase
MRMSKVYLFLGDCHNDLNFADNAVVLARQRKAEIIQLGDWGFIWPGHSQLAALSSILVKRRVTMRFVDGNHDDHPSLRAHKPRRARGAVRLARNVLYQPRGSVHEDEDGTRFLFLGGAPSIDRDGRIEGESWWPEETITDAEFDLAMSADGPIHVLVTHDAPSFPPGFSDKGSPRYQYAQDLSMDRIDALIRRHRPQRHVHGHWHCRYDRIHQAGTHITGLDCNTLDPTYLADATLLWSRADEGSTRNSAR